MNYNFPETATVQDLQRNYRKVLDKAKDTGPVFVLKNSRPQAIVIAFKMWNEIMENLKVAEENLALADIAQSEAEYKTGKTKRLSGSLLDI